MTIDAGPAESMRSHDGDVEPKVDDATDLKGGDKTLSSSAGRSESKSTTKTLDLKDASCEQAKLLIDIIVQEHEMAKATYGEYQSESDAKQKLTFGRKIIDLLVEHTGKEEIALYPAMRDIPSIGDTEVEQAKKEHLEVTVDLSKLDRMSEADGDYDALLDKIMTELTAHIADEETRLLPLFAREVDATKAKDILHSYTGAIVTTRPHPSTPHEGLAAAAAHVMSLPLDKAVDAVRGIASK